jgi:serine/threonine-protein kinase RsbW
MTISTDSELTGSIQLRTPADRRLVGATRAVAGSVGLQCDLTIDSIEDLQMAVDEACALVIPHAVPNSTLDAEYDISPEQIVVTVSVRPRSGATVDRHGLAWVVLSALADDLELSSTPDRLSVCFYKRREDTRP